MSNKIINTEEVFENIKCIVCNNKDVDKFSIKYEKDDCSVVVCHVCNFFFIPPFYRKKIDYTNYKSKEVAQAVKEADVWVKIQRNKLRYQLIHRYKKGGSVYDVGVGFGHFILTGKQLGHEVYGVELSKANVDFVRNDLNLDVEYKNFLDVSEDKKYDIVTLWDVLEHIDAGDKIIEKASRIIKDGGFLFLQIPQIDSFFAKLFNGTWWAMGLDHVNYFSKKTIKQLLSKYGFRTRKIKSSIELKNIYNYVIMPKLKRRKKKAVPINAAERQKAFNKLTKKPRVLLWLLVKLHNIIYKTASFLRIGDEMIVVAEKHTR
ncbi:class I SAM-dependent methyltransferase [candidate division KSB1 bacterium]|nr:class I SAM-dependent methyltransferase [candidate division KSB1 bacterium]MBL7094544.1 class I SAM-dependent methyltransferase [candidate division KSB1 bacterium]